MVRGKYLDKQIQCPNCHYAISRPEEKKTDVNISVRMIADCVLDATDTIVLVSADSDLVPPLEFIQKQYPEKRIKVYFPPSNFSCDLKDNLTHHSSKPVLMYKNERRFRDAIMPDVVTDGTKRYEVPEKWRPANIVREFGRRGKCPGIVPLRLDLFHNCFLASLFFYIPYCLQLFVY